MEEAWFLMVPTLLLARDAALARTMRCNCARKGVARMFPMGARQVDPRQ